MGKSSLLTIAKNHFSTLYDNSEKNPDGKSPISKIDCLWQIGIPLLAGVVAFFFKVSFNTSVVESVITALSIVSALMCSMAALVFQTRIQARNDKSISGHKRLLLDELFFNVMWAIVVGFVLTLFLLISNAFGAFATIGSVVCLIASAFALFMSVHFVLVIGMCLKRLSRAYETVGIGKK